MSSVKNPCPDYEFHPELNRRDFIWTTAAGATALASSGWPAAALAADNNPINNPPVKSPEDNRQAAARFAHSPAACGSLFFVGPRGREAWFAAFESQ